MKFSLAPPNHIGGSDGGGGGGDRNFFSGKYPVFYQNQNVEVKLHFKCDSEIIDGIRVFLAKIRAIFFNFQKRAGEASSSLPTSCVPAFSYLLRKSSILKNSFSNLFLVKSTKTVIPSLDGDVTFFSLLSVN